MYKWLTLTIELLTSITHSLTSAYKNVSLRFLPNLLSFTGAVFVCANGANLKTVPLKSWKLETGLIKSHFKWGVLTGMAKRFLGSVKANITILKLSLAIKGQSAMLHKRKIDGFSKTDGRKVHSCFESSQTMRSCLKRPTLSLINKTYAQTK